MDKKVVNFKEFAKKMKEIRERPPTQSQIDKINKFVMENDKEYTDEVDKKMVTLVVLGTLAVLIGFALIVYFIPMK